MHPLTKTADVLAVVAAGGRIMTGDRPGLLMLVDSGGSAVPAWQTALKAAAKRKPQETVRSQLRLPAELHERLVASSELSGRSMNAEIVHRLEKSLANVVSASEPTGIGDHSGLPPVALAPARAGRTYIAGPMTGLPDFNHPAFNAAAAALRAQGRTVINPADHGVVTGAAWADYVRADLALLAGCETIYLLPGWSRSRGAMLEHHVARALSMPVEYADGAETEAEGQQRVEGQMQALIDAIPKRGSDALQPAADPEDVRIARIIASKIDEGRLDHPGFYKNGRLSEALRNILALIDAQANNLNEQLGISEELPLAIDPDRIVPPVWLSEQIGGPFDDLTSGQAWRDGFNECRTRTLLLIEQAQQLALVDGQAAPRVDLAADHTGMLVDYSGLIGSAQRALLDDPGISEMLRQLCRHLEELGRRWYAGDRKVVDEFLQLYCIESEARAALVKQPTKGEGVVGE